MAYLFSTACNKACPAIVVSQKIIPEAQPVFGVAKIIGQQVVDPAFSLSWRRILQKGLYGGQLGEQTYEVQGTPTEEHQIIQSIWSGNLLLGEIAVDDSVDGMLTAVNDGR
jgi:hypothetical protein